MAGFREFVTGEVLTAANVDDFLAKQVVQKYADAAARDAALGTAVAGGNALREGMVSYLDDENEVQYFDGTAWDAISQPIAGIGSNVVQTVESATFAQSLGGSGESDAVLTASITPTSATSKVLVLVTVNGSTSLSGLINTVAFRTKRDGTLIGIADADGVRARLSGVQMGSSTDTNHMANASGVFLDSPESTSALSYTVHLLNPTSSSLTVRLNRTNGDGNVSQRPRTISSLTLVEVSA